MCIFFAEIMKLSLFLKFEKKIYAYFGLFHMNFANILCFL